MIQKEEKFINLQVLAWNIFRRWYLILSVGLVFALIIGIKSYKDNGAVNTVAEDPIQTMEYLETKLDVINLTEVDQIIRLKNSLEELDSYMEQSILMNVDPRCENVSYLECYISDSNMSTEIRDAYISYIENGGVPYALIEQGIVEEKQEYLSEIIGCEVVTNGQQNLNVRIDSFEVGQTFIVKIIGVDAQQSELLGEAVKQTIMANKENVEKQYGKHKISIQQQYNAVIVDEDVMDRQVQISTQFDTLKMQHDRISDQLTSEQLKLVELKMLDEETLQARIEAASKSITNAGSVSIKKVALGFVAGCMLVIMLIVLADILAQKLVTEQQVIEGEIVRVFGTFGLKKNKLFSKLILGEKSTNTEYQLKHICTAIKLYCDKNKVDEIYLVSGQTSAVIDEKVQLISQTLSEMGVNNMQAVGISQNAEQLKLLNDSKSVVLVEHLGKGSIKEFKQLIAKIEDMGNTVSGAAFVQ